MLPSFIDAQCANLPLLLVLLHIVFSYMGFTQYFPRDKKRRNQQLLHMFDEPRKKAHEASARKGGRF